MRLRTLLLAAAVTGALFLAGCSCGQNKATTNEPVPGSTTDAATSDGATLVKERCTRCHTVDRIKEADKGLSGWEDTVKRMRDEGAKLTDPEAETVVDFLADGGGEAL